MGRLLCDERPDGGDEAPGAVLGAMPGGACMPIRVFLPRSRAAGLIGLGGWGGGGGWESDGGRSPAMWTGDATGVRIDEFGGAGGAVEARCCGTLFFPSPSKISRSDPPLFSADILYVSCRLISPF